MIASISRSEAILGLAALIGGGFSGDLGSHKTRGRGGARLATGQLAFSVAQYLTLQTPRPPKRGNWGASPEHGGAFHPVGAVPTARAVFGYSGAQGSPLEHGGGLYPATRSRRRVRSASSNYPNHVRYGRTQGSSPEHGGGFFRNKFFVFKGAHADAKTSQSITACCALRTVRRFFLAGCVFRPRARRWNTAAGFIR